MNYVDRLEHVTVLGAAGKMGSGILLLTAIEMANQSLLPENKGRKFVLNAMDMSDEGLKGLVIYLRGQVLKLAEKQTVWLRKMYADRDDLVENGEIIEQYVNDVMANVRCTTKIETAYESTLIFEAIKEDPELKVKIFSQINQNNNKQPWFFTNTSSIPIGKLDERAQLDGRVLGVHFYNPPAIQKLVEVIKGEHTREELNQFALQLIKNMRKIAVPSNDFAGFIGNGHFMRDALYGMQEAARLSPQMGMPAAIYTINKLTQDFLVRPMGIFQLIDYVGVEVVSYIMSVMNPYLEKEELNHELLQQMLKAEVYGGQFSSGAQKDGFLKYEKGRVVGVYDLQKQDYIAVDELEKQAAEFLGQLPASYKPWKAVNFSPAKKDILDTYFGELSGMQTTGAELAKAYNNRSREIGMQLVNDQVAFNQEDVNTVMLTGFYHAYGPINEYLN